MASSSFITKKSGGGTHERGEGRVYFRQKSVFRAPFTNFPHPLQSQPCIDCRSDIPAVSKVLCAAFFLFPFFGFFFVTAETATSAGWRQMQQTAFNPKEGLLLLHFQGCRGEQHQRAFLPSPFPPPRPTERGSLSPLLSAVSPPARTADEEPPKSVAL